MQPTALPLYSIMANLQEHLRGNQLKIEDFPVEVGGLAHHRAGNKLMYVYLVDNEGFAGVRYESSGEIHTASIPLIELETPEARCIRDVEFQQWTGKLLDSLHEQDKVKETKGPTLVH